MTAQSAPAVGVRAGTPPGSCSTDKNIKITFEKNHEDRWP